jgi:rhodanese-related sulfurtransferase
LNLIDRDELKEKLDQGEDFKLVMTLGEWAFRASHIPGSLNINDIEISKELLSPDEEIVVYCSDERCISSRAAYHFLIQNGYKNVRRYAGGLSDWDDAGYPLEGEFVDN